MNRTILAGLAAATMVATYASAADMPVKAPPPVPAPVYAWTGCYIGGNVGWARAKVEATFNGVGDFDRHTDGFAGGGQVGCDYQFASNWVIGAQFLLDWTNREESRVSVLFPADTIHARMRGFGTATGRLGYAFGPSFLFYGKFGWGGYRTNFTVTNTATGVELANGSRTQSGFDLGVGGEWMITRNWSLWVEWDHIFAQNKTFFFPNLPANGRTVEIRREFDKVLVGLNWRFGALGAPVAARY